MSPCGDYLATTHVDDLGVYLWTNSTLYSFVSLRPLPADYRPSLVELPTSKHQLTGEEATHNHELMDVDDCLTGHFMSPPQISDALVTLSALPPSRWHNLLQLDIIKRRNKPKDPPKVPKAAPFFLPTVPGLHFKFALPPDTTATDQAPSRMMKGLDTQVSTELMTALDKGQDSGNYVPAMEVLKQFGPAGIEVQLRSLSPEDGGSEHHMLLFLLMIENVLNSNTDFDLAQSYLGLFLKLHGDTISSSESICGVVERVGVAQGVAWKVLQHSLLQSLCLTNYLRSAVLQ
jgi:U3 small nucleolar RNA-associated protein 21